MLFQAEKNGQISTHAALVGRYSAQWDESKHPRDAQGQFAEIHDPATGEIFMRDTREAIADAMRETEELEGPRHGLEVRDATDLELGVRHNKPDLFKPKPPEAKPEQKPLPPQSDTSGFTTGKPATATVYRGKSKGGGGLSAQGAGLYWGLEPGVAEKFSEAGSVYAKEVTLSNPVVVRNDDDLRKVKQAAEKATGLDFGKKGDMYAGWLLPEQSQPFTDFLTGLGHDGIIVDFPEAAGGRQLVEFNPQSDQTEQKKRQWFGDSKVTDEAGEPKVVFHGTGAQFDTFDGPAWFGSEVRAKGYASQAKNAENPGIIPAYLKIENPLRLPVDINSDVDPWDLLEELGLTHHYDDDIPSYEQLALHFVNSPQFIAAAKSAGFDGVFADEAGDPTYLAFEPQQIKGTKSNFDPDDSRFRYARRGRKPQKGQKEFEWITIGGHEEGGKKHKDGTPVQIDKSGKIHKGPDALKGKDLDDLDKDKRGAGAGPEKPEKTVEKDGDDDKGFDRVLRKWLDELDEPGRKIIGNTARAIIELKAAEEEAADPGKSDYLKASYERTLKMRQDTLNNYLDVLRKTDIEAGPELADEAAKLIEKTRDTPENRPDWLESPEEYRTREQKEQKEKRLEKARKDLEAVGKMKKSTPAYQMTKSQYGWSLHMKERQELEKAKASEYYQASLDYAKAAVERDWEAADRISNHYDDDPAFHRFNKKWAPGWMDKGKGDIRYTAEAINERLEKLDRDLAEGYENWDAHQAHETAVKRAVNQGKQLPDEVMAEYWYQSWMPEEQKKAWRTKEHIRDFNTWRHDEKTQAAIAEVDKLYKKVGGDVSRGIEAALDLPEIAEIDRINREEAEAEAAWQAASDEFNKWEEGVRTNVKYDSLGQVMSFGIKREFVEEWEKRGKHAAELGDKYRAAAKAKRENEKERRKFGPLLHREVMKALGQAPDFRSGPLDLKWDESTKNLDPFIPGEKGGDMEQTLHTHVRDAQEFFQLWAVNGIVPPMKVRKNDNPRSSCGGTTLHMYQKATARTWVHEIGHAIDHANDNRIGKHSKAFMGRQVNATGEEPKHLGAGYDGHEVAIQDDFYSAYTGKHYAGDGSSEVLSMGVQELFQDPLRFITENRQHAIYTIAVLRGLIP